MNEKICPLACESYCPGALGERHCLDGYWSELLGHKLTKLRRADMAVIVPAACKKLEPDNILNDLLKKARRGYR
jgi:hypothetical protein